MSKPHKLNLRPTLKSIEGCGDELVFNVNAWRENKHGRYEGYTLEFRTGRCAVRTILGELRKMHLRDRERLAQEARRIEREIKELTLEQA